jgi:SPP1 family predicted phage head-tail adaptor
MIGKLDQRITLQAVSTASDGGGGLVETWADFASGPNMWAQVIPRAGKEGEDGGAINASGVWSFIIRYRDDVTERDRIVWGGEPYNIRRVARSSGRGREAYLTIDAERGVPQ